MVQVFLCCTGGDFQKEQERIRNGLPRLVFGLVIRAMLKPKDTPSPELYLVPVPNLALSCVTVGGFAAGHPDARGL